MGYFERQAQQNITRLARALRIGCIQNALNLVIVDTRNDRPHHDGRWNTRIGQLTDGLKPQCRRRGARLHRARQMSIERRD